VNRKSVLGSILLLALVTPGASAIPIEPTPTTIESEDLDLHMPVSDLHSAPTPDLIAAKPRRKKAKARAMANCPSPTVRRTSARISTSAKARKRRAKAKRSKRPLATQNRQEQFTQSNSPSLPNSPSPLAPSNPPSLPIPPEPSSTDRVPNSAPVPAPSAGVPAALSSKINWGANVESYYFDWTDNFGNSGNQLVVPLTVTANAGNLDVGVRTALINSNFNGVLLLDGQRIGTRKGSVSTLSDTSLSLAYNLKQSDYPVRFNLDFNLPTGKATLAGDQKNAIMDGSLVQQTRFGEGFNIAPGVSVSHAFGSKDVVGLGVSYILKGQFDPNSDVVNDEIKPGNETVATLQYQHIDSNWLVSSGLIYTGYGTTQRGGQDYYRSGDRLDANVTAAFIPFDGHRVQLSGRYFTQNPNTVANFLSGDLVKESANSNGNAAYLGLDWSIATDKQQKGRVHALVDYLNVQANSYDRINDLYNAGRDKVSVGVGYDYSFSPSTSASVQAKYFQVVDKATPITQQEIRSNGLNVYGTININF
jgi:hypothetical protein